MKHFAATIVLMLVVLLGSLPTPATLAATAKPPLQAAAATAPQSPTARLDEIIAGGLKIKNDMRTLEDGLADANRDKLKLNEVWQAAFDKEVAGRAADARQHKRELKRFDHWYVYVVVWCAGAAKWLIALYLALCVVIVGTSFLNPVRPLFTLGRTLFNNLPFVGWTQWFTHRNALPAAK